MRRTPPHDGSSIATDTGAESQSDTKAQVIALTDAKRASAGIETETVQRRDMQLARTLPGRFVYDDARHVSVRAPSEGVLETMLVKTGDAVVVGQPLATLRSPPIGDARSSILSRKATLELAQKSFQWEAALEAGIEKLTQLIRKDESPESIRDALQDQVLGNAGGQLLLQYSKSKLATRLASSVGSVADSGAISGRVVRERMSAQEQTQAELEASIEQTLFQAKRSKESAEAALDAATRDLQIATQSLSTLLGSTANAFGGLDVSPNDPDLSMLTIRSPLTGTVERKVYSATERVTGQSDLFIIADTSVLWVEADIRSRDWDSIHVAPGDIVMVSTPAIRMAAKAATVYYLGREVDPASGALPLVAQISNEGGHYRPGLFARVTVPTTRRDTVIAIPSSAVVDIDGQPSVFVEREEGFVAVSVEIANTNDNQVEIRSGLKPGQTIVVAGAFMLKSELLLGTGE